MVGNYGGCVIKIGRDNSTSQALLDDLLREPCLLQIFREEDMNMCSLLKDTIFVITWHMLFIYQKIIE